MVLTISEFCPVWKSVQEDEHRMEKENKAMFEYMCIYAQDNVPENSNFICTNDKCPLTYNGQPLAVQDTVSAERCNGFMTYIYQTWGNNLCNLSKDSILETIEPPYLPHKTSHSPVPKLFKKGNDGKGQEPYYSSIRFYVILGAAFSIFLLILFILFL